MHCCVIVIAQLGLIMFECTAVNTPCSSPNLLSLNREGPLSPPCATTTSSKQVKTILDLLGACSRGIRSEPWTVLELTPDENENLWLVLERDKSLRNYVEDKLR